MKVKTRVKTIELEVKDVNAIHARKKLFDGFCARFENCASCPIYKMNSTVTRTIDCELTLYLLADNGVNVLSEDFEIETVVI